MNTAQPKKPQPLPRRLIVLIVDDDEQLRRLLRTLLAGRCQCIEAANGLEAYTLALREQPDIVLTDYEMPGINGTELARRIRAAAALSSTRVILMSGSLLGAEVASMEADMCSGFLRKPFDCEDLYRTLGLTA